ncbi:MAG TPA: hypothetical protein VGK70_10190 [Thermoanaerobaculia bacterium]
MAHRKAGREKQYLPPGAVSIRYARRRGECLRESPRAARRRRNGRGVSGARDGKLGRDVAIKVLPEAFATDAERLARFR